MKSSPAKTIGCDCSVRVYLRFGVMFPNRLGYLHLELHVLVSLSVKEILKGTCKAKLSHIPSKEIV